MGIFKRAAMQGKRRRSEHGQLIAARVGLAIAAHPHGYRLNRVSQLHHQYHAQGSIVWGGRDD